MITRRARRLIVSFIFSSALIAPNAAMAQYTVYDPTNHAENVLQAARALEQINNQIESLANEARMLASLDLQMAPELARSINSAQTLLTQARGIRQNLDTLSGDLRALYPEDMAAIGLEDLLRQSDDWLDESRTGVETLMAASAASNAHMRDTERALGRALDSSAQADGQTSALQASTQTLGVLSAQLAQLQQLQAAQARALASERLERIAREERARELRRRAFPTETSSDTAPATPRF